MQHRPRKRFGQNFLENQAVIHHILQALHLQPTDRVLEIGPGLGALTRPLLQTLLHLTAIEIDHDLHAYLSGLPEAQDKLTLVLADALTYPYHEQPGPLRIVGNLPYNISTPLLLHLLTSCSIIQDMHFMLQKEVVDRLAAQPGCKDYGRLTVMVQYHCQVEALFEVPPESFRPAPKVDSAVVRLIPHETNTYPHVAIDVLKTVVARAFSMRRKTLYNNLKPWFSLETLALLNIDPSARPEQISVMDYVRLAQHYAT